MWKCGWRHRVKTFRLLLGSVAVCIAFAVPTALAEQLTHDENFRDAEAGDASALLKLKTQAVRGDPVSQVELASMYMIGVSVPKDYAKAIKWNRAAANQDVPNAEINLGLMYAAGLGTKQDYAQAARWWHKAANQGNAWGEYFLARLYLSGHGVEADRMQAYKWLELSKENSKPGSKVYDQADHDLKNLEKAMGHRQIAKAKQATLAWAATHRH